MGSCTVKSSQPQSETVVKVSMPTCYYFNREKKCVFFISSNKVLSYKFKGKLKAFKDSGIGLLKDGRIIVVGGSDSSGSLTSKVFIINPSTLTAVEIGQLPKPVKEGHILEHKQYYYFVGGTVESDDHASHTAEEGAPIMRYSNEQNCWEIFTHMQAEGHVERSLNRSVIDGEANEHLHIEEPGLNLKHLISPGAFLHEDRIFLVGGKLYEGGQYAYTDKVFSVGLENDRFDIRQEAIRLPIMLTNCICAVGTNEVLIIGGKAHNGDANPHIFKIVLSTNVTTALESKFDLPLEETYPPILLSNQIAFISFPKIWVKPTNEDKLYSFGFINEKEPEKLGGEIVLGEKITSNPYVRKNIDLSLNALDAHGKMKEKKKPEGKAEVSGSVGFGGKISLNAQIKTPKILVSGDSELKGKSIQSLKAPADKVSLEIKASDSESGSSEIEVGLSGPKGGIKGEAPRLNAGGKAKVQGVDTGLKVGIKGSSSDGEGKAEMKVNTKSSKRENILVKKKSGR